MFRVEGYTPVAAAALRWPATPAPPSVAPPSSGLIFGISVLCFVFCYLESGSSFFIVFFLSFVFCVLDSGSFVLE